MVPLKMRRILTFPTAPRQWMGFAALETILRPESSAGGTMTAGYAC